MKNKKMKHIFFIGPISPPFNGPGIKNKTLVDELSYRVEKISLINTLGLKNRFNSLFKTFNLLINSSPIILSSSARGRYFYVPILSFAKWLRPSRSMILLPAGGFLNEEILNLREPYKSIFVNGLNKFQKIYPENRVLYDGLVDLGFNKLEILPNPRLKSKFNRKIFTREKIDVYFISSIKENKGILDAIDAIGILINKGYKINLNIHGRIQNGFEEKFHRKLHQSKGSVYLGLLPNQEVVKTLATKADVLILPTYYFGEGLPGILVEAAIAKTPVVITNFRGIGEYFRNEKNALFVNSKDPIDLAKKIEILIINQDLREKITKGIITLSNKFDVKEIVTQILNELK